MKKQQMAGPVRAQRMYLAECDFGNAARFAFNEAAASFLPRILADCKQVRQRGYARPTARRPIKTSHKVADTGMDI